MHRTGIQGGVLKSARRGESLYVHDIVRRDRDPVHPIQKTGGQYFNRRTSPRRVGMVRPSMHLFVFDGQVLDLDTQCHVHTEIRRDARFSKHPLGFLYEAWIVRNGRFGQRSKEALTTLRRLFAIGAAVPLRRRRGGSVPARA